MTIMKLTVGFLRMALVALLMVSWIRYSQADDTEIYLGSNSSSSAGPLVMFALDYRPNVVSSQVCSSGQCQSLINDGYLTPADANNITFSSCCVRF